MRFDPFRLAAAAGVILLSSDFLIAGGDQTNARGLGMAQAVVASSRGLESIGSNPSNLALPLTGNTRGYVCRAVSHDTTFRYRNLFNIDTVVIVSVSHDSLVVVRRSPPTVTLSLLPATARLESNALTAEIYTEHFTRRGRGSLQDPEYLTDAEKTTILGLLSDNFVHLELDAGVRLFGIAYNNDAIGAVALTVTDRASVNVDLPKDYLRFTFFGLDTLGSSYDFRGTNLRGWYLREYAVSYAHILPNVLPGRDFSVGVSLKLVHGFAGVFTDRFNAEFSNTVERDGATGGIQNYSLRGLADIRIVRSTSATFSTGKLALFPAPAGRGLGLDIGLSAEIVPAVRLAASLVDLGSIRWFSGTRLTGANGTVEVTNPASSAQADQVVHAINWVDTTIGEFTTSLATSVRVGGAIQVDRLALMHWIPGCWLITVECRKDLNQSPGNSPHPHYAIGSEYRPLGWLPLRTGFSYTRARRVRWSAGVGLDLGVLSIDLGTENVKLLSRQGDYDLVSGSIAVTARL